MADIPATRASLLLRLRDARNEAAWKEFVALYAPIIYNYASKHGLQDADAMDLSQEVIVPVPEAVSGLE
jgi:RNA polymerase sigma-70 factor (ECF subfamily)